MSPCSEVTKNTLMFYVVGQRKRSLLRRRRRIRTPEQLYKVVLSHRAAGRAARRGGKYPQQASILEDPPEGGEKPHQ